MFLRQLNKQQKELVLGLAILAAKANNIIEAEEEECLRLYADEMGIDLEEASDLSMEENCRVLKKISKKKEINQIVFEIAGLMMSDFNYDEDEHSFMMKLIEYLDVSKGKLDIMNTYVNEYMAMIRKINTLMIE